MQTFDYEVVQEFDEPGPEVRLLNVHCLRCGVEQEMDRLVPSNAVRRIRWLHDMARGTKCGGQLAFVTEPVRAGDP